MKEQLKFGESFTIIFDEMSIKIVSPEDILVVNVYIDITVTDKDVLDSEMFKPRKDYKLKADIDVKENHINDLNYLSEIHKVLGETKKLLAFLSLNEKNFLEKVVPELRVKAYENSIN